MSAGDLMAALERSLLHATDRLYSDVASRRCSPATVERRDALLTWIREREEHNDLTAHEIVRVSGLYGRYAQCIGDLQELERHKLVWRHRYTTPARWRPCR